MDKTIKKQIAELVKLKYPDECMIVGDVVVEDLIEDYFNGIKDAGEKYQDTDDGYNFSIYELVGLIFAGIQAMTALADIINQIKENHKKQDEEQERLNSAVMDALLKAGISKKDAEYYCQENLQ